MGVVRSRVFRTLQSLLARRDLTLARKSRFGIDSFEDIRVLAKAWNYPLLATFDVGANDGDTAAKALKELPETQVFSFEPHPATYSRLVKRFEGRPRFQAYNLAFGTTVGEVDMFEYPESKVNSLTPDAPYAKRFAIEGQRLRVKCTTLDHFCAENAIDRLDVLKIDTEGFDLIVLQGCASMLERGIIKFIYVEFNDLEPKEGSVGGALMPFAALLYPYGYRFVATYNDYIRTEGEMFAVSNALFALPPSNAR